MPPVKSALASALAVFAVTQVCAQTTSGGETGAAAAARASQRSNAMMKAAPHPGKPTAPNNKATASGGSVGGRSDRN